MTQSKFEANNLEVSRRSFMKGALSVTATAAALPAPLPE